MPPNGGFGGNTGIHDAHNLAWKLAYVLKGIAGPKLLASYDVERRPIGKFTVEQAYARYVTRTATYLGATDYEPVAPDFNVELGTLYRSSAVLAEDGGEALHDDPRRTLGRPGSRTPHLWLERGGRRISTLDLFGPGFVLLAAPEGAAWCEAARDAAEKFPGLALDAYCVGSSDLRDPGAQFAEAYGLTSTGAVLVRPDGVVAWRAKSLVGDARGAVADALGALLMR